jgi:hypothetical protein
MMRWTLRSFVFASAAAVVVPAAVAQTPAALPIGKIVSAQATESGLVYTFTASEPGILTVAVQSPVDVTFTVADADGQALPDGESDRDLYGSGGNELLAVTLPEPGDYRVIVKPWGSGSAAVQVSAGWFAFAPFARENPDSDRRPSMATALEVGASREDSLDAEAGDAWDWFVLTPGAAGSLTVILRQVNDDSPDLALELYTGENLTEPAVRSDNDQQGVSTNESATLDVKPGEKVYVKVLGAFSTPTGPYRIASSLIE